MSNSHVHPIFRGLMLTMYREDACKCGAPIELEMERDVNECVQCQADKMMAKMQEGE